MKYVILVYVYTNKLPVGLSNKERFVDLGINQVKFKNDSLIYCCRKMFFLIFIFYLNILDELFSSIELELNLNFMFSNSIRA